MFKQPTSPSADWNLFSLFVYFHPNLPKTNRMNENVCDICFRALIYSIPLFINSFSFSRLPLSQFGIIRVLAIDSNIIRIALQTTHSDSVRRVHCTAERNSERMFMSRCSISCNFIITFHWQLHQFIRFLCLDAMRIKGQISMNTKYFHRRWKSLILTRILNSVLFETFASSVF